MLNKLHSNFLGLQNSKRKVKSLSNILILRTKLLNKCSQSLGNSTIWMVKGQWRFCRWHASIWFIKLLRRTWRWFAISVWFLQRSATVAYSTWSTQQWFLGTLYLKKANLVEVSGCLPFTLHSSLFLFSSQYSWICGKFCGMINS